MKSTIYLLGVILILTLGACERVLDREVVTSLQESNAIATYGNTVSNGYSAYASLASGFLYIDGAMMASASDEAEHTLETSAIQKFNTGAWNAVDNPDGAWSRYFAGIYRVNKFLVTADSVNMDVLRLNPNTAVQLTYQTQLANVKNLKYENRFLRAYFYFELIKRYGGIPIIKTPLGMDSDYRNLKRDSLVTCIRFITNECDSAAAKLPVVYSAATGLGRITKGAALALKSKALLYAASDLFSTTTWATGYTYPELISVPGDRTVKWQAAATAAKAVIDLAGTGYILDTYANIAKPSSYTSKEQILTRREDASNNFEYASVPIGYDGGNSGTTPSQNLVDDYEVKVNADTAVPFDWNNPVHAAAPYSNRDPRLGLSILVNNTNFKGRPVESFTGGLDGLPKVRATKTGYYMLKWVDANINLLTGTSSVHNWPLIRLAEIYLNYAEALNEAQPGNADIKLYVDKVRQRSGVAMPVLPAGLDQSHMRDAIRHEDRVEFAFEDHRLWDLRRWMLAETVLNAPLKGIQITKNADLTFSYQVITVEERRFDPKMYFYPIPQNELNIAIGWVQNPLW